MVCNSNRIEVHSVESHTDFYSIFIFERERLLRAAADCLVNVKSVSLTSSYASRALYAILRELSPGSKHESFYSFFLSLIGNELIPFLKISSTGISKTPKRQLLFL